MGLRGDETREALKARLESIRLLAGPLMALGDAGAQSVPKMTLVPAPRTGGAIATRSLIPHRCHATIGVFAAVSVATAGTLGEGPAAALAVLPEGERFAVEHPGAAAEVLIRRDAAGRVTGAGTLRTARKLFEGRVFPRA